MDLLAAWLLYPLVLALLCLGLGLLVARAAGWRCPGVLIVPVGLATLVALSRLITFKPDTAPLALALIGLLAVAGLVSGHRQLRAWRPDPLLTLAALGIFVAYGAPVFLSGTPTFAGYLALPDTSHQLSLASLFADHGPDYMALPNGSYRLSMLAYVTSSYPVAAQTAVGVTAPLGLLDLAWLYQPFLTLVAVALFLALASIAVPLFEHRWQGTLVAFVAAQSALVVGFAEQGSIKELAAVAMLVTVGAVIAAAIRERRPARSLLALAVAAAAALGSLGPAVLPYLAVAALVVALVYGARIVRERKLAELVWLGAAAAVAAGLSVPVLDTIQTAITANTAVLDASSTGAGAGTGAELGHLAAPLKAAQALGLWLSGDYRYGPASYQHINSALLVLAAAAAVVGLAWALRRRAAGPLVLLVILGPISLYLLRRGSPYADSKVLMIASPMLLAFAMAGAVSLWRGRWRALSLLAMVAIGGGVLGSNAFAYQNISLAPYDRYRELLSLNERLAGKGPVLLNEYDEFGKYFLRDVPSYNQPEYPHDYRTDPATNVPSLFDPKRKPSLKTPLSADDLRLRYVESVPYVILRRSPLTSRPPANFQRVRRGTYYDLWQRRPRPRVLRHEPLGPTLLSPAALVGRATARAWGARAKRLGGRLALVRREPTAVALPAKLTHPVGWLGFSLYPGALVSAGAGRLSGTIRIPRSARYRVWMEGSFARRLSLRLDGSHVGHTRAGLENPGGFASLGSVRLSRGAHRLEVQQGGRSLRPGNAGYRSGLRHVGPIVAAPVADERLRVTELDARDWRRLVGLRVDWLEIVRR